MGPKGENCDEYPFASSVQGQESTAVTSKLPNAKPAKPLLTSHTTRMCANAPEQ